MSYYKVERSNFTTKAENRFMSDDIHLLRQLRSGDENAFCRMYERYKDDLFTIAMSVVGEVHAAEDCLHDVFVGFARSGGGIRINRSVKGYLIRSVINRARDYIPKPRIASSVGVEALNVEVEGCEPGERLMEAEESAQVLQALASLPDEQHEAVAMRIYGGMKFKEIARTLGISINTAQSRYRYGIEKLRTIL